MTEASPAAAKPPVTWRRRLLWGGLVVLLGGAVIVSIPFVLHEYALRQFPDFGQPFDLAKYSEIQIAPGQNAFDDYKRAGDALNGRYHVSPHVRIEIKLEETWETLPPGDREWVVSNKEPLRLFHLGAEQNEAVEYQPKQRYLGQTVSSPQPGGVRELVYLAGLEGLRRESEKDWKGAWSEYRAIVRASRHPGMHGAFRDRALGAECFLFGAKSAVRWAQRPEVDAGMLRRALKDVLQVRQISAPVSASLRAEYFHFLWLLDDSRTEDYLRRTGLQIPPAGNEIEWQDADWDVLFRRGEPDISRRVGKLVWRNWLSEVDKPHYQRADWGGADLFRLSGTEPSAGGVSGEQLFTLLHRTTFAAPHLPWTRRMLAITDRELTYQGLLEVVLALQWYSREHAGQFPASLAELKPQYLPELPSDPFGNGDTFRYRRESSPLGFVLWSVGEDRRDDEAKSVARPSTRGDIIVRSPPGEVTGEFDAPGNF